MLQTLLKPTTKITNNQLIGTPTQTVSMQIVQQIMKEKHQNC
jgi:hypothetical protein